MKKIVKQLFKLRSAWFPVWLITLLMLIMISVYLPVFSGANKNVPNVPLIFVNEDQGTVGASILMKLKEKQNGNPFNWRAADSEKKALNQLKNNQAHGALIIPANFSKEISEVQKSLLSEKETGKPATLKILLNEGIGQSSSMIASNVLQLVAASTNQEVSDEIKIILNQKGILLSPENASLMDNPVQFKTENVLGLPDNLNKGMTPFVMVIISSITGMMGANMIRGYLRKANGDLENNGSSLSYTKILKAEMIFSIFLAFGVSSVSQIGVFGFFGSSHTSSIFLIYPFSFFCCLTMISLFKSLSLIFGGWGMLVMFPINIMGIFSSGGPIPLSTLPIVHRIFSYILPTKYMVDGMRALLYYNGRMQAGLGTALFAISVYFIVTLAIILAFIVYSSKRDRNNASEEEEENMQVPIDSEIHAKK
ncbi:ABC transporter permease [Bacillus sp. mrc49]|uniref:ABC transporter permease n=1 Tax=Bacillus sp. mrc49 TaxID=2054913 RepID=UPI002FCD9939